MFTQYGLGETLGNCKSLMYTRLKFPGARLVRLPFYLRGADCFSYGKGFTTGYGCRFDLAGSTKTLVIGSNVKINDRVHIVAHESVIIGDNVLMGSNIFITDTSHGTYDTQPSHPEVAPDDRPLVTKPTRIGNNAWIGEGACILPGVELGDGCIVGANAVVTRSFPEKTIVAGVPAVAIKRWNDQLKLWERVN